MLTRRDLLIRSGTVAAGAAPPEATDSFTFVHMTDLHIQPELRAADGCRMCFESINRLSPDLVIAGGDLVFDAFETLATRGSQLYDLYAEAVKQLNAPVRTVIGNHDVFGVAAKSGVKPTDARYGKRMLEDRIGPRYYSFAHKGWQFIALDSIYVTEGGRYVGRIDDEQLSWLKRELEKVPKDRPLVVMTHIPLLTAYLPLDDLKVTKEIMTVANCREVLDLLWPYRLKAVLQGHTHVRETVTYNGCQFITSGAVSGNWWRGARLGHPEGFGVLAVKGGEISWSYRTYGFHAESAPPA